MRTYKTAEAAAIIGIHPNTVRFYEEWGLITKPEREKNGYRVYTDEDIRRLKIIRSLRCANYSLEAILRMLQQLSQNPNTDIREALNTPKQKEDIISACDKLLVSLEAEETVLRRDREYKETKQYMVDYRNEMDGHEKLQTERLLQQTDYTGAFAVEMREKVAKLKDSPYFARIDFLPDGSDAPSPYYIGRFGFVHHAEQLIFDWRAPISGMFYDYDVGRAGFDAPVGRIEGELTRKRQFRIKDGVMEYALESTTGIQDDILQKELAHTSDEKMKSIISTIQREQNVIIRNEGAKY